MTASMSIEHQAPSCRLPPEAQASARFDALYVRQVAFVWRSVRSLGVSPSAVADVAQDVFLQVHRHLDQWEGSGSERAWLFAFVRRTVANHRRGLRRRPGGELIEDEHVHAGPGPEAVFERQQASRIILGALEALDEVSREHIVLVDLEQLSVPEAAEALGQNVNTTYTRLRNARTKLRDLVLRQTNVPASAPKSAPPGASPHGHQADASKGGRP